MAEDYYKLLGVRRDATKEQLQSAFQKLARKYHPDVNPEPDAQKKFQEIQQAYEVLSDDEKRQMYDLHGSDYAKFDHSGFDPGSFAGGSPFGGGRINLGDLGGIFGAGGVHDMFGGGTRQSRRPPTKGNDLQHTAEISFKKAIEGGSIDLHVRRHTGKNDTISMKIPPGVVDGAKLRVKGQGDASRHGGAAGDIVVTIKIKPHASFRRNGKNLEVTVPITLPEAMLGGKIDVPTPAGVVSLTVPPGSSGGARLRVKGQGVKPAKGDPGDILVTLQIVLPKTKPDLSEDEKRVLEKYAGRYETDVRSGLTW